MRFDHRALRLLSEFINPRGTRDKDIHGGMQLSAGHTRWLGLHPQFYHRITCSNPLNRALPTCVDTTG